MRRCWGGDYNRELKFIMLDHAFQSLRSVIFHVGEGNARSRKALEKIGAKLIARVDRARPGAAPTMVYEICRMCRAV